MIPPQVPPGNVPGQSLREQIMQRKELAHQLIESAQQQIDELTQLEDSLDENPELEKLLTIILKQRF